MGTNTYTLDENGYALCVSCKRKFFIKDLEQCAMCDRWLCRSCGTYLRQGYMGAFGYFCKSCMKFVKENPESK